MEATRGCFATNKASSWDSHRSAVQLRSAITFLKWLKNYSSCDLFTEFIYSEKWGFYLQHTLHISVNGAEQSHQNSMNTLGGGDRNKQKKTVMVKT